jgi:hypothetical protein
VCSSKVVGHPNSISNCPEAEAICDYLLPVAQSRGMKYFVVGLGNVFIDVRRISKAG